MRIIGGHDYWDSAAAYGVDETVTLVRNTSSDPDLTLPHDSFNLPIVSLDETDMWRKRDFKYLFTGAILVAGKAYPFFSETNITANKVSPSYNYKDETPPKFFYDLESLVKGVPSIVNSKKRWYFLDNRTSLQEVEECMTQPAFSEKRVSEFLIDNKAAYALLLPVENRKRFNDVDVFFNTSYLQHYDFYKVMDPFTMHMTVANWVSGVLASNNETVKLSDKSKIGKAGFDYVTSFRNMKRD